MSAPISNDLSLINSMHLLPTQPLWIDTQKAFDQLCQQLLTSQLVTLDTEFIRRTTYFPILALLQIASPDLPGQYLIDPTKIDDWSKFTEVLGQSSVCKVVHAGQEDLEILQRLTGVIINNLFDTQLAYCCVGGPLQMGYGKLVQHFFGIELNNHFTCSDWQQRPLSSGQADYAAKDVQYLPELHHILQESLEKQQRTAWLNEEVSHLQQQVNEHITHAIQSDSLAYLKIHEHWLLTAAQRLKLQKLTVWREQTAQLYNVPKRYIADDEQLLNFARQTSSLASSDLQNRYLRQQKSQLTELLSSVDSSTLQAIPDLATTLPIQAPLAKELQPLSRLLKNRVTEIAQQLGLTPEFLCGKKLLTQLIRSYYLDNQPISAWPNQLTGWRYSLVIQDLIQLIQNTNLMPESSN